MTSADESNRLPESNPSPQAAAESSEPSSESSAGVALTPEQPGFGWTSYAERINGRFAMIGFVALIILELITHQSFFEWLGL